MGELNPLLGKMEQLENFNTRHGHHAKVHYMRYKGIWPVQDRDFVNVSVIQLAKDITYIASMGSQYPYGQGEKATRAKVIIAGYILKRIDENQTHLTYISDVDLAGWIPHMLQNKVN